MLGPLDRAIMPFTLAHPAAAVPLLRPLGRWGRLAALVSGSMAPDFLYFTPIGNTVRTHSLAGLFAFCLPAGLLAFAIFEAALKAPLVALLPRPVRARLAPAAARPLPRTAAAWLAAAVSVLVGALTHLVCDGFTHADGFGVQLVPALAAPLPAPLGPTFRVHSLLQYGSSVVGLALLARWVRQAQRRAPAPGVPPGPDPLSLLRAAGWLALTVAPAAYGLARALPHVGAYARPATGLHEAAVAGLVAGCTALWLGVCLYAGLWHLLARRAPRA
jgi:hypothetical protein